MSSARSNIKSHPVTLASRRWARALSDAMVKLTAPLRMRPDFLIVGGQRCGTTSLFKPLMQHPAVARPFLRKGVHYFDLHYDAGLSWYRGHFAITVSSRMACRGRAVLTGESSPYYMFHPQAPGRIVADLPDVNLLVLLRDPDERAYSAHAHEIARGFESLPFPEALEAEPDRIAGERERRVVDPTYLSRAFQHNVYVTRGQYVDQLLELERAVGREQMLVLDSGDFFAQPEEVFGQVVDFLGLPMVDGIRYEQHYARVRSAMSEELRGRLIAHYACYDQRLADWWGQQPSWRRS